MSYRRKLLVLSALVGGLALVYGAALVLDPERVSSRAASYAWIESEWLPQVDGVEIISRFGEQISLALRGGRWFILREGGEYPAKDLRVEDFLRVLSARAAYSLRASSAGAPERLGLTTESASRIVLRGGAGRPLLDLLIGRGNATGNEIYLRKNNQPEIRSGEDRFSVYVEGSLSSWYDLRLFPEGNFGPADVQRLIVTAPAAEGDGPSPPLILTRNGGGWILDSGGSAWVPDTPRAEAYIRAILGAEGEGFNPVLSATDPVFTQGSITLELGNGGRRIILLGPLSEQGRRSAAVPPAPYVYELADWTLERLFRNAAYFAEQP